MFSRPYVDKMTRQRLAIDAASKDLAAKSVAEKKNEVYSPTARTKAERTGARRRRVRNTCLQIHVVMKNRPVVAQNGFFKVYHVGV